MGVYTLGGKKAGTRGNYKGGKGSKSGGKKNSYKLTAVQEKKLEEIKTKVNILVILDKEIRPNLPHGYWSSGMRLFETTHVDLCPLHNEDTGSFRIFPATNSCSCYAGCGGGDPVWLYREFYNKVMNQNISFTSAIEYLHSTYVEGKKAVSVVYNDLMKATQLNTPRETFTFFLKMSQYEGQLSTKKVGIGIGELLRYYRVVDQLRRLIITNEILASDAVRELDEAYKEVRSA